MALWSKWKFWARKPVPVSHQHGDTGERAAREFLRGKGFRFLTANYSGKHGEIDAIFRDGDCLVFVEVKTRSSEGWTRPSKAVDLRKRKALYRTAQEYLALLETRDVRFRFDIVEVLLENGDPNEIRHIVNATVRPPRWQPRR